MADSLLEDKIKKLEIQSKAVQNQLFCVVCQEQMRPPIVQCCNGHTVCNICYEVLSDCPICRIKLDKLNKIRNLVLDQIAETFEYECKYYPHCTYQNYLPQLLLHEQHCKLMPLSCPTCSQRGFIDSEKLAAHYNEIHGKKQIFRATVCWKQSPEKFRPTRESFLAFCASPTITCGWTVWKLGEQDPKYGSLKTQLFEIANPPSHVFFLQVYFFGTIQKLCRKSRLL